MSERIERDFDTVLAALAREIDATAPRPTDALVDAVLADAALTALSNDLAMAAPRPSSDLVARVLADAAAARAGPVEAGRPVAAPTRSARGFLSELLDQLSGWRVGAVAAMMLALAVGLGLGLEGGAASVLDGPVAGDTISLASLGPGFLEANGL